MEFSRDKERVLERSCSECHRENRLPGSHEEGIEPSIALVGIDSSHSPVESMRSVTQFGETGTDTAAENVNWILAFSAESFSELCYPCRPQPQNRQVFSPPHLHFHQPNYLRNNATLLRDIH